MILFIYRHTSFLWIEARLRHSDNKSFYSNSNNFDLMTDEIGMGTRHFLLDVIANPPFFIKNCIFSSSIIDRNVFWMFRNVCINTTRVVPTYISGIIIIAITWFITKPVVFFYFCTGSVHTVTDQPFYFASVGNNF